ncbi:unnamed protein product [Calypogeia fissa]
MPTRGVPNAMGMLMSGHHLTSGYRRYDRTETLKMEAAALQCANPNLDYESALRHVSKKFVEEDLKGSSEGLTPLDPKASRGDEKQHNDTLSMAHNAESSTSNKMVMPAGVKQKHVLEFPFEDNGIDWDAEIFKANGDDMYRRIFGGMPKKCQTTMGSDMTGNLFHNCNVTIKTIQIVKPGEDEKENESPSD